MMKCFVLLCALFILAGPAPAEAGKLFARMPGKASPIYNLRQIKVDTRVSIHDRLAVTHVDETFNNTTALELEGFYVFELPDNAHMDGLWMWIDGKRITFTVKRKEEAQRIYDSLKQNNLGDPVILESLSANRFQMRLHPIRPGQDRRIELQYFELLPVNYSGIIRYAYPLNMSGYQTSTVEELSLSIDLHMGAPIEDVLTSFDDRPMMVGRTVHSDRHHTIFLQQENILYEEDFVLEYVLEGWTDSLFILSHGDANAPDSSTFLAWFPDTLDISTDVKTDFIFAIDASGSMTGLRSNMVREAMGNILSRLMPYDRFHIIFFNESTRHFPADTAMSFVSPATLSSAHAMLNDMYSPRGITDYDVSLSSLSGLALRPEANKRCIFITDGMPNRGNSEAVELLPHLRIQNSYIVFYPLTIYTQDLETLDNLAKLTGGKLCALEQGMDIDDALRRTTFAFESGLVHNAQLEYSVDVTDVFPIVPVTTGLQSFVGTGRFSGPQSGLCRLRYNMLSSSTEITVLRPMVLAPDTSSPVQIARYWAAQRIDQLLDLLRDVEDSTEIREAVIRLSEKYMVLTPFTAFIVFETVTRPGGGMLTAGELAVPEQLRLEQNYPNPFNPSTTIRFTIPHRRGDAARPIRLCIYGALGRLIRVLSESTYAPGTYELLWDGCDASGSPVTSGTYFADLTFGEERRVITMTLLK